MRPLDERERKCRLDFIMIPKWGSRLRMNVMRLRMPMMKAVRLYEFGGPDKLVYEDQPLPDVGRGDVLVKVIATSVSRWDIKYRIGEVHEFYGKATGHAGAIHGRKPFPMPMQLGRDVAGEVAAAGDGVTTLKPGDRVIGLVHPENPLSVNAIRGLGNLSTGVDLPGHTMFGGYAQFVARPEGFWIKASARLDCDQAAAAMWACATAHHIVATRLNTRVNDIVLVTGASGGMGTATMALAKLAGSTVIATTRHAGKAAKLREAGADLVVDTTRSDALSLIREFTGGEGVDGAVEFTGETALMRLCIDAMRHGGTVCPVGGELKEVPLRVVDLVSKELNVRGVRASTRNDQRIVAELLEKGRLAVPIHTVLPLTRVGEAHAMLERGDDLVGRIVLHPWD
jgi:NADPH:quinone reductase-like Zn-dependent oxidoreductase